MGKQKTKLGARILSKEEMNAILPNAESIDEQIEVFRESLSYGSQKQGDKQGDKQFETEQKTNNIGIIGRRGAGKTSILKTFYHKLKNENAEDDKKGGDIILPIIVPENMSSGTTLMDTILGRLKSIVEEKMKEDKKKKYVGDCIYVGKYSLEWMYNELVKQYCYIKKDYRDILIQQFTTEQNYVDKTKKVFSSDSEFITMFNQFLTELLRDQDKDNGNSMMFLFIDDVDLSTNKCMDIVRTLLVYLSNPRIVTFISGDIQTFEEELTLEFLRQEDALREDAFRETYYSVNHNSESSLLERKKQLAYEYLKKIIPPAYRRAIRYWDLDERGNYKISGNEGDEQKSLVELLVEVTKEKLGEMYFVYKEDDKTENMRLAFHMFDDTSRGLNNVYNVLQEIYDLQISDLQKKEKNMTEAEKELLHWRLIETMIDSKPLYTKYKSDLLKYVIVLGQGRVKVDFANAYQLLYGKTEEIETENKESMKSVERFAIYYLIDFAAKLFSEKTYDNEDKSKYSELKNKIIQEYLQSEEIDGKIPVEWKLLDFLEIEKTIKEKDSVKSILINILTMCDFIFVLHIIRCLGRAEIYDIVEKNSYSKENAYKTAYAFSRAVQALNESEDGIQDYLTDLYIQMQEVMLNLLNTLSLDPWVVYGRRLVDNAYIEDGMRFMGSEGNLAEESFMNVENYMNEGGELEAHLKYLLWAKYENEKERYWIYYERKLREKQDLKMQFSFDSKENVLTGVIKTIMNQMKELNVVDNYEVKPLKSVDYDSPFPGKDRKWEKRKPVLEEIDEQGLWDTTYAKEKIKLCLERSKHDIIHKMCSGRMIFNATHFFKSDKEGAYSELKNCYKGTSGTALVYGIESKVRRVMSLSEEDDQSEQMVFSNGQFYLSLEQVLVIQCILEEFLHFHNRVVYGKKEVRKLLMEVKELPLALHTSEWDEIHSELKEREDAFFFKGNPDYLRSEDAKRFDEKKKSEEREESKNIEIEQVRERYYEKNSENAVMEKVIKEFLGKTGEDNKMYIKYLVQKAQIKEKKKEVERRLEEEGKKVKGWDSVEKKLQEKEGIFIFQSYLRYLQENESEAKKAGARAEDIVKLAKYMLDSEIKADERIQNEVYQIISKKIDITENEFELLF